MSKPRTPTNLLDARGAFRKNPKRKQARKREPKPRGVIGDAPAHMSEAARGAWAEIVAVCPLGVLTDADRHALELTSMALAACRANPERIGPEWDRAMKGLSALGMNPTDRSKVQVVGGEDKVDPFAQFLN